MFGRLHIGVLSLVVLMIFGLGKTVQAQHTVNSLFDKILPKADFLEGDSEPSAAVLASRRQRIEAMMAVARANGDVNEPERHGMASQANRFSPAPEAGQFLGRFQFPMHPAFGKRSGRLSNNTSPSSPEPRDETHLAGFIMGPEKDTPAMPRTPTTFRSPFRPEENEEPEDLRPLLKDTVTHYESRECDSCLDELDCCDGTVYEYENMCGLCPWSGYDTLELFTTFDSFKGPIDLDNRNANFGVRFGGNLGFALLDARAIGIQVGTSETIADFHGTEYTGSTGRYQNFTTVGIFRRNPAGVGNLSWGFAYDWLYDNYYDRLSFGQWRVKLAYEWDFRNELGLWAVIPEHGDSAYLGHGQERYTLERFKSISQINFYHAHHWNSSANTACWIGWVDEPGEVILGADAEVPLGEHLAVVGGFQYIIPSAGGIRGQDEDMWYTSVGIQWKPGHGGIGGRPGQYTPFMRLADNGIFSIRRR